VIYFCRKWFYSKWSLNTQQKVLKIQLDIAFKEVYSDVFISIVRTLGTGCISFWADKYLVIY
jgi:hypothetical protein